MDSRKLKILMLLDFSRAFDTFIHSLSIILIPNQLTGFVHIWVIGIRSQKITKFTGAFSNWMLDPVGVPQGSKLSAMLLSIYRVFLYY